MKNRKEFYTEVIDTYFSIDSQREDFLQQKNELELKEILELWNKNKEWNKNKSDILHYIEKYISHAVKTDHPQFLNRMWTWANPAGIAGEIIAALQQTSACTYESAPVSTLMEKHMISTIADIVWFKNWEWQMTTGSSNANMIAMMIARNLANNWVKSNGLFQSEELFWFVNKESHYSFDNAANTLWIGSEHLIKVPVNSSWEMNIESLEELLENYSLKWKTFFVAATAWTTVRWAYDNIEEILKLKEKYNFWLHVDWAWWWPAFFSDKLRKKYLSWLENVDSFCFDFHKMPWVALISNMFLINNRKWVLKYSCWNWNTDYIFKWESQEHFKTENDFWDLWVWSLQCWRRVDSLKLFLDWKYYGQKGFAEKVERYLDLCEYAENLINKHPKLEMTFERMSFNTCFHYITQDISIQNDVNKKVRDELYNRGLSLVWSATIDNKFFLRLLICNENVSEKDIDIFFENVVSIWDEIV